MKKFTKKVLIFVIIIAIITVAVNYIYTERKNSDGTERFAAIPDTVQICNFGSSHGVASFNYTELEKDYTCFNFALGSQYPSYDYRIFQYYGSHIDAGTVVFIPISYFSLFGREEAYASDFPSKNRRYYSILPASLIKEYDFKTDIFSRYFPALAADPADLVKKLLNIKFQQSVQTEDTDIDFRAHAESRFSDHIASRLDASGHIIENQEEIDAIYALIRGCQEKGAIPVLITTPYLHEYTDVIKENMEEFYPHFYSIINQIVADTGAEYYDYAFDEQFVSEYSWFENTDHLNREGARNFVNIIMNEIVYEKGYY